MQSMASRVFTCVESGSILESKRTQVYRQHKNCELICVFRAANIIPARLYATASAGIRIDQGCVIRFGAATNP